MRNQERLKSSLDRLYESHGRQYLDQDPLRFVHRYADPSDQEIIGFIASAFAYGRVDQILKSLDVLFTPIPNHPSEWILECTVDDWISCYEGFRYRFQSAEDFIALLWLLQDCLLRFGSIENSLLHFCGKTRGDLLNLRDGLTGWVRHFRMRLGNYPRKRYLQALSFHGIHHLLPDPASGSPCKRWNLFLRWMVRGPDALDLGIWKCLSPSELILPLDTHTARICRYLDFTRRALPSWTMAEEITEVLRRLNPEDPIRYDFSLARLGISEHCPRRRTPAHCRPCEMKEFCHVSHSS